MRAAPQSWLARVHRAIALNYVGLSSAAEAEQHLLEAIGSLERAPRGAEDPRIDYGAFLFREGRTAEALRVIEPVARETPASPRAYLELGRVMLHMDRVAEAATCLQKAVELEPGSRNAHLLLGRAYLRLGRTNDGEKHLRLGQEGWAEKR